MSKAVIDKINPIELSQRLIRCPSVTPDEGGALDEIQNVLEELGFRCQRLLFSESGTPDVDNLYARLGDRGPNFCFAGHSDVVPPGDRDEWGEDPFSGVVIDGKLFGRGSADMKSAIASFISAVQRYKSNVGEEIPGSISLLITGDEEGPAINGTIKVLDWMSKNNELIDACIVGEPQIQTILGK